MNEKPCPPELEEILQQIYKAEGLRVWWTALNYQLDRRRPCDVWDESPEIVLALAKSLQGQVST